MFVIWNLFTKAVVSWAIPIFAAKDGTGVGGLKVVVIVPQRTGNAPARTNSAVRTLNPVVVIVAATATFSATALFVFQIVMVGTATDFAPGLYGFVILGHIATAGIGDTLRGDLIIDAFFLPTGITVRTT